jgi:hypothetical protein
MADNSLKKMPGTVHQSVVLLQDKAELNDCFEHLIGYGSLFKSSHPVVWRYKMDI